MSIISEFKEFAVKGNAVDLAIGIVIGIAFGKIISSLVSDIIMPPIGLLLGGIDFSSFFIDLSGKGFATVAEAKAVGAPVLAYGLFISAVIDFLIIAFVIFIVVKQINKMKRKEVKTEEKKDEKKEEANPSPEVLLLTEIRDTLKNKK